MVILCYMCYDSYSCSGKWNRGKTTKKRQFCRLYNKDIIAENHSLALGACWPFFSCKSRSYLFLFLSYISFFETQTNSCSCLVPACDIFLSCSVCWRGANLIPPEDGSTLLRGTAQGLALKGLAVSETSVVSVFFPPPIQDEFFCLASIYCSFFSASSSMIYCLVFWTGANLISAFWLEFVKFLGTEGIWSPEGIEPTG